MTASQNGWHANDRTVITSYDLPGGRVALHTGSAGAVLVYVAKRFHAEVEPLVWPGVWGYAERLIRDSTTVVSNHASGTAIDLNAPKHPLGTDPYANYTSAQIGRIHAILRDCRGLVRWGGDYIGRKDGMHFEINDGVTPEQLDSLWTYLEDIVTPQDIDAIATAVAAKVRGDQFTIQEGASKGTKIAAQTALRDVYQDVAAIRDELDAIKAQLNAPPAT